MTVHIILCNLYEYVNTTIRTYHIAGKFGKFGESSIICQTKTIQMCLQLVTFGLISVLICQTFVYQMLKKSKFIAIYSM